MIFLFCPIVGAIIRVYCLLIRIYSLFTTAHGICDSRMWLTALCILLKKKEKANTHKKEQLKSLKHYSYDK